MKLWLNFKKRIPSKVQVGNNHYEVLYTDGFNNENTLGETRLEDKQIILRRDLNSKELVKTYLHECLHAISEEFNVGLSEQQILNLEEAIVYVLKEDNFFKKEKK